RVNLNVLHAGLAMPDTQEAARLESASLVDWPAAARLRFAALHDAFSNMGEQARQELDDFRRASGEEVETHARFEAIHAEQFREHGRWHWRDWPSGLRDPNDPAVASFAERHAEQVRFHAYLQ